ncbi:MAG: hypothetical protein ACYC27_01525 [Armatimonadota bacterium]
MIHELAHLQNAQDQATLYINHLGEAQVSSDISNVRSHMRDAIPFGRNALVNLAEMLDAANDPYVADNIEEAMDHLGRSLNALEIADKASDDEIDGILADASQQAELTMGYLTDVIGKLS